MESSKIAEKIASFEIMHISNPREVEIHRRLDEMRAVQRSTIGYPQKGLQLLAPSFSGKSTILRTYTIAENSKAQAGLPVFYMELQTSTTPNQMLDQLLTELGDPIGRARSEAERFQRVCAICRERGIQLLIFDEIQHIISHETSRVAWRVTESFKRLLNAGVAPIVFAGDESATSLFGSNPQLRNRMLRPSKLPRLSHTNPDDIAYALAFFDRLDSKMVADGLIKSKANLSAGRLPAALCAASGGALGTACNIVREALKTALERNADKISAADISKAVEDWAIPLGFTSTNPLLGI